ncbi:hypothetical protein D7B24_003151 [Verticillium nonalfalfae]|uniref:INSIG domain-containing protein n=1 Tax=Verticillium nonalfalfae TaxID=1051616 RepID=A0A3M9XYC5_9PEZI|nr:uncharacterized protein D7B24_003151 [Verticillium nonalfalfae]RNJ52616.1 hypothetical protein D7B24_003151 [Verticillium nonalfalfae]
MSEDGPPLLRPIPRRPFDINFTSPTPPSDGVSSSPSPAPGQNFETSRLLSPKPNGFRAATPSESGTSISRTQSIVNLTTSTLFGIYSPSSTGKDRSIRPDLETPWGTGSQTPVKRQSLDDTTFELLKERFHPQALRRRSSRPTPPAPSTAASALYVTARVAVLFLLGMGYGALVTRLHGKHQLTALPADGTSGPGFNWKYLTLWGICGVLLGALLPWFDGVWEEAFGGDMAVVDGERDETSDNTNRSSTDWALGVRSIGAFVGIVFAIRRLPWASTLQLSLTLALVNPFLWYLIDRSKPGFLLSAAVGLIGSAVLMGVDPEMVPTPSASSFRNETVSNSLTFGGLASQKTMETGIWMLSVLFCSCVCFGNIGRRLALSKPYAARGRCA